MTTTTTTNDLLTTVISLLNKDELAFVLIHLTSITLAILFYHLKKCRLLSTESLHMVATVIGLTMVTVIFGSNIAYMLLQVTLAWIILSTVNNSLAAAVLILIDSMAVLCYLHTRRLYMLSGGGADTGDGAVDFTAPIMISTQKLTSLAFSLHDYQLSKRDNSTNRLSEENRKQMIDKRPTLLQLMSYTFFFHGVIVGPLSFYRDYIYYMEEQDVNYKLRGRKRSLIKHLALTLALAVAFIFVSPKFPASTLVDDNAKQWSIVQALLMTYLVMMMARIKYYFAWNLGSCIQLTAGYGYDTNKQNWTGIKNVSIINLELATSPKSYIDAWNTSTNAWLRLLAHSRLPEMLRMPATLILSAIWHGFFPGYYFTFITAIPIIAVARQLRRIIRPRIEALGSVAMQIYHCFTWLATQITMAYLVVPFTLLHIDKVLLYYRAVGWILHYPLFILLIVSFVLPKPKIIRREIKKEEEKEEQETREKLD